MKLFVTNKGKDIQKHYISTRHPVKSGRRGRPHREKSEEDEDHKTETKDQEIPRR